MGCVSSNDVKETDPPIEKAEATPNHNIPEIQINGPSNSTSKENGLSNHHTVPPPDTPKSQTPPSPQPQQDKTPVKAPEPLFPHVSPFKPQFDYRRDVTLSPRASRYLEMNGSAEHAELSNLYTEGEGGTEGERDGKPGEGDTGAMSFMEDSSDYKEHPGVLDLDSSAERPQENGSVGKDSDSEEPGKAKESSTPVKVADVQLVVVEESTPSRETVRTEESTVTVVSTSNENKQVVTSDQSETTTDNKTSEKLDEEDRSAILASFLANQAEPDVLSSDDDSSQLFPPRPHQDADLLANQVEDDPMQQSKTAPHPLIDQNPNNNPTGDNNGESLNVGDKGDVGQIVSVLEKVRAVGGTGDDDEDVVTFSPEDKHKINELLNEIEAVAEKNGFFDKQP